MWRYNSLTGRLEQPMLETNDSKNDPFLIYYELHNSNLIVKQISIKLNRRLFCGKITMHVMRSYDLYYDIK